MDNFTPYFARPVSYKCKMFIKSVAGRTPFCSARFERDRDFGEFTVNRFTSVTYKVVQW
jgi:hypothetical protein